MEHQQQAVAPATEHIPPTYPLSQEVVVEEGIKEPRETEERHPKSPDVALWRDSTHYSTDGRYKIGHLYVGMGRQVEKR